MEEPAVLAPLVPDLACLVLKRLSFIERLDARLVSKGWCAFLDCRLDLWSDLDISPAALGASAHVSDETDDGEDAAERATTALLRAASARAGGFARSLNLTDANLDFAALCEVAAANAGALAELRAVGCRVSTEVEQYIFKSGSLEMKHLRRLLDLLPCLKLISCAMSASPATALKLVNKEPPYGPVHLCELHIGFQRDEEEERDQSLEVDDWSPVAFDTLAQAIAAYEPKLSSIQLQQAPLGVAANLEMVVNIALRKGLEEVGLVACSLSPASLPLLTLLLAGSGALRRFRVISEHAYEPIFTPGAHLDGFAAALTGSRLTRLDLIRTDSLSANGVPLLRALTGHPTLVILNLSLNESWAMVNHHVDVWGASRERRVALAAALAALVSTPSALRTLACVDCKLNCEGVAPLFAALARPSARLRELDCRSNNISQDCFRNTILPALRANTSLRELFVDEQEDFAELKEAMELVAEREDE